ncbi:MAG: sulfotransferase family protein [Planctomycetota bacterium]|nr:sulfotransferase family protein [Planctomycetota bacterium]
MARVDRTLRINMWSGPRNVSTAMMYAFAERSDTRVIDEPLYAHYLARTGADHPGRDEVLAAQDPNGERVVRDVILGECDRPVLFLKQMAHHLVDVDHGFLARTSNVLLTRDPLDMLPSLAANIAVPTLRDTGYAAQVEILRELVDLGQNPAVLVASAVLEDPRSVLTQLCARVGIAFEPAMLSWRSGPRAFDGVWAPHWYAGVHRSTGFQAYRPKSAVFPERLRALLEECRPYFEALSKGALRAEPPSR